MKLALYQMNPGRDLNKYGVMDIELPTIRITIHEPTKKGLSEALDIATRADAQLVRIPHNNYTSNNLKELVQKLIRQKRGIKLFMPAIGIEREIAE